MSEEIDRQKVREALGKHLTSTELKIPLQENTIKDLLKSGLVENIIAKLPNQGNSDWCVACGASHGVRPTDLIDPVDLSNEKIDALTKDLLIAFKKK